jgi:hypothetical protein
MIPNHLTQIIVKYLKVFLVFDFGVILFCFLQDNMIWLLNTQIAFVSVMNIVIGSFLGYHKNIMKQVDSFDKDSQTSLDNDAIDKIEDPHDLYSKDGVAKEKEISAEEFKKIVDEERVKQKGNKFQNTIKSATGFASLYRILGYVLLITGFFYLNNNGNFEPMAYIVGVSIIPISILVVSFIKNDK